MSAFCLFQQLALTLGVIACLSTPLDAALLTWTGSGDGTSFTDTGNWSGTPTGGTIDKANLVDDYVIDDPTAAISEDGNHELSGGSITVKRGEILRPSFQGMNAPLAATGTVAVTGGVIRQWFLAANAGAGTALNATIDGDGEIELFGAGAAINNGLGDVTIDILSSTAKFTFLQKTASEVVSQYTGDIFVAGAGAVFGVDPLVLEAGDNAYVVENAVSGADNVTVFGVIVPEPTGLCLMLGALSGAVGLRRKPYRGGDQTQDAASKGGQRADGRLNI